MNTSGLLCQANKAFIKHDYKSAIELYQQYAQQSPEHQQRIAFNLKLAKSRLHGHKKNAEELEKTTNINKEKIIVYTVNIGSYESVKEPLATDPSVEYILFTDDINLKSTHWEIVQLSDQLPDPRRTSRLPKILAHKYLPAHDISVYIDSSFEIKAENIRGMVSDCLFDEDIALYKHYERNCVYDEIEHVRNSKERAVESSYCDDAIKLYQMIEYPKNNGLFENGIIIRRNSTEVNKLNELWWDTYLTGCVRDQFYLMYCLKIVGLEPNSIEIGEQIRKNPFINHYKHTYKSYENKKSINWLIGGESSKGWAYDNNARRLIKQMPDYRHSIDSLGKKDCAVYFDILIAKKNQLDAHSKVLRIGGPRPIIKGYGDNNISLKEDLQKFHTIIALNNDLKKMVDIYHPNVKVIPNSINLEKFSPTQINDSRRGHEFVVGFCGSINNDEERDIKGIDYIEKACAIINVKLLSVGRGKNQVEIPHKNIIEDFYSKIDILVHPVKDGKEGCSNVIMEAISLGIPVITTKYSGYHAEYMENGKNIFIVGRNVEELAILINKLKDNKALLQNVGQAGRIFSEKHHDVNTITIKYKSIIDEAIAYSMAEKKIAMLPFWLPIENTASSRLRCMYPKIEINNNSDVVKVVNHLDKNADVYVVIQTCDDLTYDFLKSTEKKVVYDICDRLFLNNELYPSLNGKFDTTKRFFELADLADEIICPTEKLKAELQMILNKKKITCIPDSIDINSDEISFEWKKTNVVTWFGNPGRGNFESSKWMLDYMVNELGFTPQIISNRSSMKKFPDYYNYTVDWSYSDFIEKLSLSEFCVISHSPEEQTKSPNRLLLSLGLGIPTMVNNSFSMANVAKNIGLDVININTKEQIKEFVDIYRCSILFRKVFDDILESNFKEKYGICNIAPIYLNKIFFKEIT